ncbi:MAG: hypothetical protein ABI668_09245 [Sphingorhabdus sp.]
MVLNHLDDWTMLEGALIEGGLTPMFGIDLLDGERISIVARYTDFPILPDQMFPNAADKMLWFGKDLGEAKSMTNIHGILVQSLPANEKPLALAEINGFSIMRSERTIVT